MLLGSIMVCLSHKISDTLQFLKIGARLVRYRRSDLAAFISHDSRKDAA